MSALERILAATGDNQLLGVQSPPDYLITAPQEVRDRVQGLKGLQREVIKIETEFYERVHELEAQFRSKYEAVNAKRKEIVSGQREPTAEEKGDNALFYYLEGEELKKFNDTVPVAGNKVTGIPNFWLHTLQGVSQIAEVITPEDESILKHLTDITVENIVTPPSFKLHFHFSENEYFTNQVLTKEYKLSIGPNGYDPEVMYDGPSVVGTSVASIDWKAGKDVTKKVVKQKQKKGNAARYVAKTVDEPSFFQFFSPAETEITPELSEEAAELLNADFEVGQLIRENVVDNAVLYYTGEIRDEDDFDYGDGEDFEDQDDEDEE